MEYNFLVIFASKNLSFFFSKLFIFWNLFKKKGIEAILVCIYNQVVITGKQKSFVCPTTSISSILHNRVISKTEDYEREEEVFIIIFIWITLPKIIILYTVKCARNQPTKIKNDRKRFI